MKRCRFDILAGIAKDCLLPKRKTQIMFRGNLGFSQANTYLDTLVASRLIAVENKKFRTTDKGQEFLSVYDHLVRLLQDLSSRSEEGGSVPTNIEYSKPLVTQGTNVFVRCLGGNGQVVDDDGGK